MLYSSLYLTYPVNYFDLKEPSDYLCTSPSYMSHGRAVIAGRVKIHRATNGGLNKYSWLDSYLMLGFATDLGRCPIPAHPQSPHVCLGLDAYDWIHYTAGYGPNWFSNGPGSTSTEYGYRWGRMYHSSLPNLARGQHMMDNGWFHIDVSDKAEPGGVQPFLEPDRAFRQNKHNWDPRDWRFTAALPTLDPLGLRDKGLTGDLSHRPPVVPAICRKCNLKNDWAVSNQSDGSYLCYECR